MWLFPFYMYIMGGREIEVREEIGRYFIYVAFFHLQREKLHALSMLNVCGMANNVAESYEYMDMNN